MKSTAGKGSSPRNCFSANYRKNYDEIFRKPTLFAELVKFIRAHIQHRGEYPAEIPITNDEMMKLQNDLGHVMRAWNGEETKFCGYPVAVRKNASELRTFGIRKIR